MARFPYCRAMQVPPPPVIPEPRKGESYWDWRVRVGYWPEPQTFEDPAVYAPRPIPDPDKA